MHVCGETEQEEAGAGGGGGGGHQDGVGMKFSASGSRMGIEGQPLWGLAAFLFWGSQQQ